MKCTHHRRIWRMNVRGLMGHTIGMVDIVILGHSLLIVRMASKFVSLYWCQDTSDPRHVGTMRLVPKCPDIPAPVPNCLADTSALVPNCLDLQRTYYSLLLKKTTDFMVIHKNTQPSTSHYT